MRKFNDREKRIKNFKSEKSFGVEGLFQKDGSGYILRSKDLIFEPLMFIIFRLNNLLVSINYNFESYANRFSNLTRGNASN